MRAIGCFVFAGSMSIGIMNSNFTLDLVLEMTDDIIKQNAAHFKYNYPDIPVLTPSEWENEDYLEILKYENFDLLYGNPPCSALSQINRNADVNSPTNNHMRRFLNVADKIEPKVFLMENAPTLISRGKPILDEFISKLSDRYRFTLLRDFAGNHGVCMKRQRTMLIGWRRDQFQFAPLIRQYAYNKSVLDIISNTPENDPMNILVPERTCQDLEWAIEDLPEGISLCSYIVKNWDKYENRLTEAQKHRLSGIRERMLTGRKIFDKSPVRPKNGVAPSLASMVEIIHPIENRQFTIREYLRLMGYPDTYNLDLSVSTPKVQCIAQGVPARFVEWVGNQINSYLVNRPLMEVNQTEPKDVVYEKLSSMRGNEYNAIAYYTTEEFLTAESL